MKADVDNDSPSESSEEIEIQRQSGDLLLYLVTATTKPNPPKEGDGQCGQSQQGCHTEIYPPDSMEKALVVIYALITNPVSITIRCTGPSGE